MYTHIHCAHNIKNANEKFAHIEIFYSNELEKTFGWARAIPPTPAPQMNVFVAFFSLLQVLSTHKDRDPNEQRQGTMLINRLNA